MANRYFNHVYLSAWHGSHLIKNFTKKPELTNAQAHTHTHTAHTPYMSITCTMCTVCTHVQIVPVVSGTDARNCIASYLTFRYGNQSKRTCAAPTRSPARAYTVP